MRRRALVLGLPASVLACSHRREPGGDAVEATVPSSVALHELTFTGDEGPGGSGGSERAVVLTPKGGLGPWPLLIAIHGRGEAVRGAHDGAYGWVHDYRIGRAIAALQRGKLTADDFQGLVTPERLDTLNRALAEHPYQGLVIACPHAPDFTGPARLDALPAYGAWLTGPLARRVSSVMPVGRIGIDGVSMGGRMALRLGLVTDAPYHAVGSLQAALSASEVPAIVEMARAARVARPTLPLRVLTSEGDYFRPVLGTLHDELTKASLSHDYRLVAGPHNYQFNQGPGSIEMLLWHDRVLRGLPGV